MKPVGERIWRVDGPRPGRRVCIVFGVHGDESSPIEAGRALVDSLASDARALVSGALLLIHANWKGTEDGARWSEGGVDLNRCFHGDVLAREPARFEERRAREMVLALEEFRPDALVDFHCTVEPGERFAMHHPSVDDPAHRAVTRLLTTDVVLGDPALTFGGVSLDEWASTRGKVGICYETGWRGDPSNTGAAVLAEMENVLRGTGLLEGAAATYDEKRLLELDGRVPCEGEGFRWEDGVGRNLQACPADTRLGVYSDGAPVVLERDATLVFPKKKPGLVKRGEPLVFLAARQHEG